jgi:hypothetical protein
MVNCNNMRSPINISDIHYKYGLPEPSEPLEIHSLGYEPLFEGNNPFWIVHFLENILDISQSMFISKYFNVDTADKRTLVQVCKGLDSQLSNVKVSVDRSNAPNVNGPSSIVITSIPGDHNQFVECNVHELSTSGKDPEEWLWSGWDQIEAHAFPGRILASKGNSVPTPAWERIYGPERRT